MDDLKIQSDISDNAFHGDTEIHVLLITNRDSDNVGDQVIEACDISLVKTAIKNLGFDEKCLNIRSIALSNVTDRFCETDDTGLLGKIYKEIGICTFVLFGGAPVFNYRYQYFYKKTATIINVAKELGKPVLFSAIGINDAYDEKNPKCMFLKDALHNGMVRQVTTRDGIEHLRQYAKGNSQFPVSLVSDPAVFARDVFCNYISSSGKEEKKIGLFVFRAGGFSANGIQFGRSEQCCLWKDLCSRLDALGYDYELLTSGHFADEAVLEYMIDEGYVKKEKCIRAMNTPEELVRKISSYSGIVSCRLHPSIISFSCNVPSVSLIWNSKVTDFYKCIGHPERAVSIDDICADAHVSSEPLVTALECALKEGINKDNTYVESVYTSLVTGIARCIGLEDVPEPFSAEVLRNYIIPYQGTTLRMEREKVERKLTRCYRQYNTALFRILKLKEKTGTGIIDQMLYHSGEKCVELKEEVAGVYTENINYLQSGNIEFIFAEDIDNDGTQQFAECGFVQGKKQFKGWRVRFRIKSKWYWLLADGGFYAKKEGNARYATLFLPGETIPEIPVNHINVMVAEAVWQNKTEPDKKKWNLGKIKRLWRS